MFIKDPLRLNLAEKLFSAVQKISSETTLEEIYTSLVIPPNQEMGHLALGCFILAKKLKMAPPVVAQQVKALLDLGDGQITAEAAGPYINFKFSAELMFEKIKTMQKTLSADSPLTTQKNKVMIEYSQPNTHKELHVGHMRNLCLGNALVRLQKRLYGSDQVIGSTFPGDVGTHVAKCLWYIKRAISDSELDRIRHLSNRGEWLGQMYSTANMMLEDEAKTERFEQNKAELTAILKQLEAHSGPFYDLWKETREWSIELMKRVYKWADVEFDRWYWESEVDADSVKTVKKYFAEGKLQESQGAIGYDLENEKLGFCMLLKTDGTGLYATKDLELARRKFNDFGVNQSIYVVDQRQALHFKQVFRVLEILGFEQAKNCVHLQYNFVELPDGAMSSRKGNIVPLMQLVDQMKQTIKTQFLEKYRGEWSNEEIELVSNQVASGAIKYGMIRQDSNKKIVFEMAEWLKVEGESGPFIQYSAARINSLIQKFGKPDIDQKLAKLLTHNSELKLLNHVSQFLLEIQYAAQNYKPATLCTYLYELAKKFNGFYHDCSIGQAETADLQKARLMLAQMTLKTLTDGLKLLGIPTPARM